MKIKDVVIRPLQERDLEVLAIKFLPPNSTIEHEMVRWKTYFMEIQERNRTTYVLELENELLGYGSLLRKSEYPHFNQAEIPEINAIWIGDEWRGKGLATTLIAQLEELARKEGYTTVGIGVGLYQDYGPAQKLYHKLGYAPDGNGVTYINAPVVPGNDYPMDDELIYWMTKSL